MSQPTMATAVPENSYDRTPYRSYPFKQTHPDRLATIARLFGLETAQVEQCRVLELGCASGGNLIPMAEQFPESQFFGIDGSIRQVRDGQALLEKVGLKNIELRHQDILEFDAEPGSFDYIISHGVYSWVPDAVQRRMLEICRKFLAPNGVAYISYNTYPGWHMREMIRDIMRYRARSFENPQTQLNQARGLLTFLTQSVKSEENAYGMLLKTELAAISRADDSYLLHEHLEEINSPLYFHQFADRAVEAGLQYLGEADFGAMSLDNFPDQVRGMLQSVSRDVIEAEQYMDFLRNRAFRQTLLCHREVPLNRQVRPQSLLKMRVASPAKPEGEVNVKSGDQVTFRRGASVLQTNDPLVQAAMLHLRSVWPLSVPFVELASIARSAVHSRASAVNTDVMSPETEAFAETLIRCFATSQLDLHVAAPRFVTHVSERTKASPLARIQAKTSATITNRLHDTITVDDFLRQVLAILDGTRESARLTDDLVQTVLSGELVLFQESQRLTDRESVNHFVSQQLIKAIEALVRLGAVVG